MPPEIMTDYVLRGTMAEYNNAAGRILAVFDRLAPRNGRQVELQELAKGLDVHAEWPSVFNAYCDLKDEYQTLVDDINSITENSSKKDLFQKNLPDIDSSLNSFDFNVANNFGFYNISQTGLVALRFIAADLKQDESASAEDINSIRQLVTELQQEIETATAFSKQMKEWLLDLVRVIRDSIDRYANRGSRGMRKQFSQLLGELIQNYDHAQEVQDKTPSIWAKIISAIDVMNKIASLAEKCKPAISFGQKLLPLVKTLGLPSPTDQSP
jgi:hypothetical protein